MSFDTGTAISAIAIIALVSGGFLIVTGRQFRAAPTAALWGLANIFLAIGIPLLIHGENYALGFLCILINAARGTVVEIEPLAEAIKARKLLGAAIDVFPVEPKSNKDEFLSPLRGLDNVILTPHIGGSTLEAQANIGLEVAEKLVKYSDNGTSTS